MYPIRCPSRSSQEFFRSLTRDKLHAVEKEQVIKLLRAIVEIGSERHDSPSGTGTVPLSEPVMRALIAVAEHAEDAFRPICIETLAEIRKHVFFFPQLLLSHHRQF